MTTKIIFDKHLIRLDQACDYLPFISTVSNCVDIVEKCIFRSFFNPKAIAANRYISHINNKSFSRCFVLLLPVLGNILIRLYDLNQQPKKGDLKLNFTANATFSSDLTSVRNSFAHFIEVLENDIFPHYERHEAGFDKVKIHGRMHIARAIVFSEVMARYYYGQKKSLDFDYIRLAVGFHDSGREGNGVDIYEKQSSDKFYKYLIEKNMSHEEARQKSGIINKKGAHKDSIEFEIFQSADCLDIMRPCTGHGGRDGFKSNLLTFLAKSSPDASVFRQRLIEEAWKFIDFTEKQKHEPCFQKNQEFMNNILRIIQEHKNEWPILSSIL